MIKQLKKRERAAYPSYMRQMQYIRTWADLQGYCEHNQVSAHLVGEKGYLIMTPTEVVDLVASPSDIWKVLAIIKAYYGSRSFTADFRETTSWKLVCVAERRGKLRVSNVSQWYWESEIMYEAEVSFVCD
jgi:hypothetical protein